MGCSDSRVSHRPHRRKPNSVRRRDKVRREPGTKNYESVPVVLAEQPEFEIEQPQVYKSEHIDETTNNRKIEKGLQGTNVKFKLAIYAGIHNIKVHHEDDVTCRIRGAEFLPNGNLIVCDQANQSLKLWNSEFKSLAHVKLSGKPHDLCVHASNKEGSDVYVTIPSERLIHEFYVESTVIVAGQKIRTDGWCYGIAPNKTGLVVCVGKPHDLCVHASNKEGSDVYVTIPSERLIHEFYVESTVIVAGQKIRTDGWCYGIAPYKTGLVVCVGTKIVFLDTDGQRTKVLQYDETGKSIFGSAFHVCVTPDHNILVTDTLKQVVIAMNADGKILFRYKELSVPHGAITDKEGNIFLCGADDQAVDVLHQVTNEGEKVKSLLSWRHVGFKPDVICYREQDKLLAVCGDNDRIKTFKLETRRSGKIYSNDAVLWTDVDKPSKHRSITPERTTAEVQRMMKQILKG